MGYESFVVKDINLLKIVQNAKKFGVESMQNEDILNTLLNTKLTLTQNDRSNIEMIFKKLMDIEQKVQLSKP